MQYWDYKLVIDKGSHLWYDPFSSHCELFGGYYGKDLSEADPLLGQPVRHAEKFPVHQGAEL